MVLRFQNTVYDVYEYCVWKEILILKSINKLMSKKDKLKQKILALTKEYYDEVHGQEPPFEPGKTFVNYGGVIMTKVN